MTDINHVHLRGTITGGEPKRRELPSGLTQWVFEVRTTSEDTILNDTVPCYSFADTFPWKSGELVDVIGKVRRRYFRVGGATQSRTEVQANTIVRIS